jgi:hypothetical protein
LLLERMFQGEAEAVCRAMIEAAKGGDVRAGEIILARLYPVRKGGLTTFALPAELKTAEQIDEACASVLRACGEGRLTVDEAAVLTKALRDKGETVAIREIRRDLDNLINARPWIRAVR